MSLAKGIAALWLVAVIGTALAYLVVYYPDVIRPVLTIIGITVVAALCGVALAVLFD